MKTALKTVGIITSFFLIILVLGCKYNNEKSSEAVTASPQSKEEALAKKKTPLIAKNPIEIFEKKKIILKKAPSLVVQSRKKPEFKIWKTIKLASGQEIDLILVSVKDLGLKEEAKREDIYTRAKELDLDLCPSGVANQLILQNKDPSILKTSEFYNGVLVIIGMQPEQVLLGYNYQYEVLGVWHDKLYSIMDSDLDQTNRLWNVRWVFSRVRPIAKLELKVWKTIKLGTGLKNADDFRKAFENNKMEINPWLFSDMIDNPCFAVATEKQEVDLVLVTLADLGFRSKTSYKKIYARVKELGLKPCPAEVGPQLRLQYTDQPKDAPIIIGMEPIFDHWGYEVFIVDRGYFGLCLSSYSGTRNDFSPDDSWNPYSQWAFVLPRK